MRATLLDDAGEPFQDMPLTMWPPPLVIQFGGMTLRKVPLTLNPDQEIGEVEEIVTTYSLVRVDENRRRGFYCRSKRGDA